MSNDKNNYGLEEQRRKKAENFKLNIRDNYDDDGSETGGSAGPFSSSVPAARIFRSAAS